MRAPDYTRQLLSSNLFLNNVLVLLRFWAVFFSITYETHSNLQSSVIQTAPALVGIVNALIHTRVGLGWLSEQTQTEGEAWPASLPRFAGRKEV